MVGRSFVSLRNLLFNLPVEHSLLVVSDDGKVVGRMRVVIMPGVCRGGQLFSSLRQTLVTT